MSDAEFPSAHFGAARRPAPPGVSTMDRLVAHDEIRQLAARYALAVSAGDLDALVELFVPDALGLNGKRGPGALRELFTGHLRETPVNILLIAGHLLIRPQVGRPRAVRTEARQAG